MNKLADQAPISEPWNLRVSAHAIERYKVRANCPTLEPMRCANNIRSIVIHGKEVTIKDKTTALKQFLAHDCKEARYFRAHGLIAVVSCGVVVTVHEGTADRWTK